MMAAREAHLTSPYTVDVISNFKMNIYSLNHKLDKKDVCGSFVGIKNDKLICISIEKFIKNKKVHYRLKESFEYCNLLPNEKPLDALFERGEIYSKSSKKDYKLNSISINPGDYYPRIYRPLLEEREVLIIGNSDKVKKLEEIVFNYPVYNPYDTGVIVSGLNQLATLKNMLIEILNTVYPSSSNLKTFGHQIKNLLVLSCIEVEAQLKGVYKANEINSKRNYSTRDYIKLKEPMQLHKYSVKLPLYPELKSFEPFKKWNLNIGATKSLKWYDNYNAVKHNNETEFHRATLESAIASLCAVVVLLKAQYGNDIPFWREEIGSYFEVSENTKWSIKDSILPPIDNDWKPNKLGL